MVHRYFFQHYTVIFIISWSSFDTFNPHPMKFCYAIVSLLRMYMPIDNYYYYILIIRYRVLVYWWCILFEWLWLSLWLMTGGGVKWRVNWIWGEKGRGRGLKDRKNFFEEITDMSLSRELYSLKVGVGTHRHFLLWPQSYSSAAKINQTGMLVNIHHINMLFSFILLLTFFTYEIWNFNQKVSDILCAFALGTAVSYLYTLCHNLIVLIVSKNSNLSI